jgi:hypothetical protein
MKVVAGDSASVAGVGPLAFLSIQHAPPGVVPDVFTNEERARAFRNVLPVVAANTYRWPFRQAQVHAIEG